MSDKLFALAMPTPESAPAEPPNWERIPLNAAQKTMARRMLQSARDIPQFSVSRDLVAEPVGRLRTRINAEIEDESRRVSVTALMIWLTARSLLKHPRLNSRFDEDAIIQHRRVNMAVAMDTPYGLVAPVIREVETLSVSDTAQALRELAARAAAKRLSLGDFSDATFTISNLGMLGATSFRPMINPPQGAIMGVGGPRLSVRMDADGKLVPAKTMEVTVTADHRILEGGEVARFLQALAASFGEGSIESSSQAKPWK
jgi:pyruvate dehydrogenase E2 component (dihydrolipoamide acetyltransferase)